MEIKRMPRSQFLKLTMENNNNKKNTESECSTKKINY